MNLPLTTSTETPIDPVSLSPKKKKVAVEFPIILKSGVKVYKGENRGRPIYTVTYITHPEGRRRESYRDLEEAITQGKARAEKIAAGDLEALRLSGRERQLYVAADEAIKPTGVSLDVAARDFAAAFAALGGNIVVEAARYYAKNVLTGLPKKSVAEAVASYIAAKETERQSELYMKDLRGLLGRFKDAFNVQLREVTADQLRDYLQGLKVGPVTRNNHLRLIRGLFTHAKAHAWLDGSRVTPADAIKSVKSKDEVVEIFTPSEMESLLTAADKEFRPWLILTAFCGVRREEVSRLTWAAIDFEQKCIVIPANVAKTGKRRKIDLQPNALQWLTDYKNEEGSIFAIDPRKRMAKTLAAANTARKKAKLEPFVWKSNGLRHSFCSYRLEMTRNAGQVALEAGNSAGIIMRHYHEVVSAKDAAAWWAIVPPAPVEAGKIVSISQAA